MKSSTRYGPLIGRILSAGRMLAKVGSRRSAWHTFRKCGPTCGHSACASGWRKKRATANSPSRAPSERCQGTTAQGTPAGDDLVQRLCAGEHAVEVSLRPKRAPKRSRSASTGVCPYQVRRHQRRYRTGGQTRYQATDLGQADFAQQSGQVHLVGGLTLNYVKSAASLTLISLPSPAKDILSL